MSELLSRIESPADLQTLTEAELVQLAHDMREELVRVLSVRPAHFASNLGVVELALALHLTFDFRRDRLIWDTGHQIYPHKLITGRYRQFASIRTRGGLMGYPNPAESDFDLFMTGHAGCSISCGLGLRVGDEINGEGDRHSVVVIGDGALPSGIAYEALNNAGGLDRNLLVILNDNKMSICPRTGGLARMLDQARLTSIYQDTKHGLRDLLKRLPLVGGLASNAFLQLRDGLKAAITGGMMFEELGVKYFGPIDGHNLADLRRWLRDLKDQDGPKLLHVLSNKGQGVAQAADDPVTYHTPPVFAEVGPERTIVSFKKGGAKAYTDAVSAAIHQAMADDPRVVAITAAMCQGTKLEKVRSDFPGRFFDTGITESHAVAFAAGLAKAGLRPIVAIYSTFLQRAFDQIFQEVALQNLPVTFCLDRAGVVGADGPTHHGVFDTAYMRIFPNMTVMAPGDELDVAPMLRFALGQPGPTAMRYPRGSLEKIERDPTPMELGQAEILEWGVDGALVAYGCLLPQCSKAAERLRQDRGLDLAVVNARFVKPIDRPTLLRVIEQLPFVITVEESALEGGFGGALLEAANAAGLDTSHVARLGVPDHYIEHAERPDQLKELGLDADGVVAAVLKATQSSVPRRARPHAWAERIA